MLRRIGGDDVGSRVPSVPVRRTIGGPLYQPNLSRIRETPFRRFTSDKG